MSETGVIILATAIIVVGALWWSKRPKAQDEVEGDVHNNDTRP